MFDRVRRLLRRKPKPPFFDPPGLASRERPQRDPHDQPHPTGSPTERWLRGDDLTDEEDES